MDTHQGETAMISDRAIAIVIFVLVIGVLLAPIIAIDAAVLLAIVHN
jgi:hypothetical protein